jgi:dTDP-4-dehydrorhamnose reductase
MRILVTGSNGLLGQKLSSLFLKNGVTFLATGVGENRNPLLPNNRYTTMDVTNSESINAVFDSFQPTHVIHGAAMTNVDACETDQKGCYTLNVEATQWLVEACSLRNIHLTHVSTDFIFDGKDGPYAEDDNPNPLSYYGWSKLEAEKIVQQGTMPFAILRTVLVYGVMPNMSRSNIVLWAKGALEKQQSISVVDDQFRTPTLAEDLAQGCWLAASKMAQGVFNISGKDFMSIYELVERVALYYGYSTDCIQCVSSSTLNQPAKRPPRTGFILDKANRELGYAPHSFEEGMALMDEQLA